MKKKIILIDPRAEYVSSALQIPDCEIALMVIDNHKVHKGLSKEITDRVKNFYFIHPLSQTDFEEMNASDFDLTYDEIWKHRSTHLKVGQYLERELYDSSSIQYRYYTALRYFLSFFENNQIDVVLSVHMEHGAVWDSLILDLAVSKGIPAYSISVTSTNMNTVLWNFVDVAQRKLVSLKGVDKKHIDVDSYYALLGKYTSIYKKKKSCIRQALQNIKSYGAYMLNAFQYMFTGGISYTAKDKRKDRYTNVETLPRAEKYRNYIYVQKLRKFYQKLAEPADYSEKFIYYPLHQEPEASIMVRTPLSNQLWIIKCISESLPEGWTLYVKEHPSVFNIYDRFPVFYKRIDYHRHWSFYTQIKKFKNVKLIDLRESPEELVKQSSAVNSICGTQLTEAVLQQKPIIVWSKGLICAEYLHDAFNIESEEQLKKALQIIAQGDFTPDYADLGAVINEYAFEGMRYMADGGDQTTSDKINILQHVIHRM